VAFRAASESWSKHAKAKGVICMTRWLNLGPDGSYNEGQHVAYVTKEHGYYETVDNKIVHFYEAEELYV